ncbi:thioredoxin domain-containing protein 11 [Asbolus verrucosus]|uniref:Thioredoxin domain-containing protein 11 n=1 Tax=Asbolus verrucosus TaxID=1661398 RepID=A0A482VG62_ASBVE|nr:thioredoxin domain-containing protein 11 [Asbolus verrucosus]
MSSPVQESGLCDLLLAEPGTSHNNEIGDNTADSSDNSDSNDKSGKTVADSKSRPTFVLRMLNFCKEVTIMVLIAVAYATLTNETPPKVSKSPAAYPFFPKDSLVTDWYRGQITEAIEEARSSDIAFVMFYAPWDAESQAARKQFELAAKFMYRQVAFASINCWQPGSECKRQYSKVYKWPVLIAYPTHGRGIQYNGPLEAFHMIKFLQNICKPIIRPYKMDALIGKHDQYEDVWNPETLSSWIFKNLQQVAGWITPTGTKSLTLADFVQPGPTLILFTPKNPLLQDIDYYNMLREVAYEYYNCANDTQITARQKLVNLERLRSKENYQKLKRKCVLEIERTKNVMTNVPNIWTNSSWKDICNCVSGSPLNKICRDDNSATNSDQISSEYLRKSVMEEDCREFLLSQKYGPAIFERKVRGNDFNITGLACKTNLTLAFIALDSLRFYHFAEKLGVDLPDSSQKSGVVIINEKMETHHIMESHLSSKNVRLFIYNFTQRTLPRSLHSQVVVVFYYSKQCSFCNGISYMFLTTAKLLSDIEDVIFVRIDGDANLLPWEYTMETYPTILLIPANRKSESRALPKTVSITVPNLIGFILTNVQPVLRLKIMWSVCCRARFIDEKRQCMASVRMETLTIIDQTLKEWRNSTRKQKVLYKLQVLRQLHLLLAHYPTKVSNIRTYLNKLRD